jgi:hypothetical protein
MPRTTRKRPLHASKQAASADYAQLLLRESINILVKTGHSPKILARQFQQICSEIGEPSHPFDPTTVAYVAGLPHVVAHWYGDPVYVDVHGQPIPLRLHGPGPSLAALIRRVFPRSRPARVARSLVLTGAVRRRANRYVPTDRYVSLSEHPLSVQIHGLDSAVGLLRTVSHNSSAKNPQDRLLECASTNLHIPVRALTGIHKQLKRMLIPQIWKVDGLHRAREVKPGSEPTVRLKVGFYVAEDPIVTGVSTRARASTSSRAPKPRIRPGRHP